MPRRGLPEGFKANFNELTGLATCPATGCGEQYTSRNGYIAHIQRCTFLASMEGGPTASLNSEGGIVDPDEPMAVDTPTASIDELQIDAISGGDCHTDSPDETAEDSSDFLSEESMSAESSQCTTDREEKRNVEGVNVPENADSDTSDWEGTEESSDDESAEEDPDFMAEEVVAFEDAEMASQFEPQGNFQGFDVPEEDVDSGQRGSSASAPKPRTAEWYQSRRDEPLYPGCPLTMIRVAFLLLSMKVTLHMQDNAINALCKLLAFAILPEGNCMPHTLYQLKQVCEVDPSTAVAYHCCPNDHFIWGYLPRAQWLQHTQDVCPECGEPRLVKKEGHGPESTKYTPAKVVYYFGLERCIKHLHSLAMWNKGRSEVCRDVNIETCQTFFGTPYAKALNKALLGMLNDIRIGIYELGTDWFSFFADKRKKRTTGVFFLRALDIANRLKDKRFLHIPLIIIPGPREPKFVQPYVNMIIQDFMQWQPRISQGIDVTKVEFDANGSTRSCQPSKHWPVLASWIADGPARQKVAEMRGHAAYQACAYCWIPGCRENNRMVFPYGYRAEVEIPPQNIPTRNLKESVRVMVGSIVAKKSCKEMVVAGQKVQAQEWDKDLGGCNGLSAVAQLPYVNYKDVWLLGTAHIILLGLVPDFIEAILPASLRGLNRPMYAISPAHKRQILIRQSEVHMPSGRPRALCIVRERGSFDMSHWWLFVK